MADNDMSSLLDAKSVVTVAVIAVALPFVVRVVSAISSPLTLFFLSPFIILLLACLFLFAVLFFGHLADKRTIHKTDLQRSTHPFAFSTPAAWQAVLTRSQWSQSTPQPLHPLLQDAPLLSTALNDTLVLIVRDFVLTWYQDISSSPSFPMAVSSLLHASFSRVLTRVRNVDAPVLVVKRIIPKITCHIELFRQSEMALRGAGLERKLTQSDELDLLLASRYSSNASEKLHPAIDNLSTTFTKQAEEIHLRQLVDRALPYILPEAESRSETLRIIVREIIVCTILQPIMDTITDPDFWNRSIDQVAGAAIHQQKLITKVRNILEAQSPRKLPPSQNTSSISTELITIRTKTIEFESFLRSISRFSSLLDARRLRSDIGNEIRRTRILLANHEKDDWINGEKTEDVVAFLDRLYTAKRKVEERIAVLGGDEGQELRQNTYQDHPKSPLTLRDILGNPSSLSYFMEFMDRRRRSLLVQFWLTVESFKNPLESIDFSTSDEEEEMIQDHSSSGTIKEDISMINDLYFARSIHPVLASIPMKHVELIRAFAASEAHPSATEQWKVRRAVMLAQRQIEQVMEQDFEEFERSALWFRAINDTEFGVQATTSPPNEHVPLEPQPSLPITQNHSVLQHRPITSGIPRGMQRSASSSSQHSINSMTSLARSHTNSIEVLMSSITESSSARPPLFDDPEDQQQREEERRMQAIKAALTDIMALEEQEQGDKHHRREGVLRPSPSPGIVNIKQDRRRPVFDDDIDEDDAGEDADDAQPDSPDGPKSFQLAGPGDLQLSYEIARLGEKITSLETQVITLDTFIKKAELTGDAQELKLLVRSKSSMARDIRELKFQKLQYEQQESANRLLSDRTHIFIVNSTVGDEDGKSVVRYLVEVQQLAHDGSHASGWVVARRYNEFFNLHNKLRERYALVRNLDFPGKRLVTSLSGSFLDSRRTGLERYLQNLIAIPIVCESNELRTFLSRDSPFVASNPQASQESPSFSGTDLVRNMYRSVAESIDDMFFGPSMLDVMIQRLTRQAAEFAGIVGPAVNDEELVAQALNVAGRSGPDATLLQLTGDLKLIEGETSTSTFSAPMCDLVLAIFELNKKNNWLRRQAIVIILQQVFGGTIERKIRDNVRVLLEEHRLLALVKNLHDTLWPGGKLRTSPAPRTAEEKMRTRDEANKKLSSLVPDLAANMIGRSNARRGARRMFAVLQNRRLNQHILYTIMDEVFAALFPEPHAFSQ